MAPMSESPHVVALATERYERLCTASNFQPRPELEQSRVVFGLMETDLISTPALEPELPIQRSISCGAAAVARIAHAEQIVARTHHRIGVADASTPRPRPER